MMASLVEVGSDPLPPPRNRTLESVLVSMQSIDWLFLETPCEDVVESVISLTVLTTLVFCCKL